MKKIFLALMLLAGARVGSAQTVFAPIGAEWWYYMFGVGGPGYVHLTVTDTTQFQGHTCAVVQEEGWYTVPGLGLFYGGAPGPGVPMFYTLGEAVYYVRGGRPPQLLLDFSRSVGHSTRLEAPPFCATPADSVADAVIDSIYTDTSYGVPLRVQVTSLRLRQAPSPGYPNVFNDFAGMITERVGYPSALVVPDFRCGTDPENWTLLAYRDADVLWGAIPTITVMSTAADLPASTLMVSPNPSTTGIFELEGTGLTYTVHDALGRQVAAGRTVGAPLDLRAQPAGLYLLRATDAAGRGLTRRLVRE